MAENKCMYCDRVCAVDVCGPCCDKLDLADTLADAALGSAADLEHSSWCGDRDGHLRCEMPAGHLGLHRQGTSAWTERLPVPNPGRTKLLRRRFDCELCGLVWSMAATDTRGTDCPRCALTRAESRIENQRRELAMLNQLLNSMRREFWQESATASAPGVERAPVVRVQTDEDGGW